LVGDSLREFHLDDHVIVFLPFNYENMFNPKTKLLEV